MLWGWILWQTFNVIEEVHSERQGRCGGCGCQNRNFRQVWVLCWDWLMGWTVLWDPSHFCFSLSSRHCKVRLSPLLFVNGSFPDAFIYMHTRERFCPEELSETSKSSQHSDCRSCRALSVMHAFKACRAHELFAKYFRTVLSISSCTVSTTTTISFLLSMGKVLIFLAGWQPYEYLWHRAWLCFLLGLPSVF